MIATVALAALAAFAAERVLRRSCPDVSNGRWGPWRLPWPRALALPLEWLTRSRFVHLHFERAPLFAMHSDIEDVVYVNYLIDAERAARLVPEGLELQRLGPRGDRALFTHLTYRHGHFGPRFLPALLRWLLPSPIQSNWRIHVRDPHTGLAGIEFIDNVVGSAAVAVAARVTSEGVSMHVPRAAHLTRSPDGAIDLLIDPGTGSAMDVRAALRPSEWQLPPAWREVFPDPLAFLTYCVPQDRALSAEPWLEQDSRQEINLGITPDRCEPLAGEVVSEAARRIAGDVPTVCFRVARVDFLLAGTAHDRWRR